MRTITRRDDLRAMAAVGLAAPALGCAGDDAATEDSTSKQGQGTEVEAQARRIRILATSDTHGMFCPWDYAAEEEYTKGSLAQLATAVKELRDENTILVDAGDVIQGNMNSIFLAGEVNPMVLAMNEIGYDVNALGNHEFDYGMDVVRKTVASFGAPVLCGNVIDENGDPIADAWTIIERDGVRIGLIGMVTPNIVHWNAETLVDCTVSDPVEATKAAVEEIKDAVDVLVAVVHMGLDPQYDVESSGARFLAASCPELDLVVAAHDHERVEGEDVSGVLVVENEYHVHTVSVVDFDLTRDGDGWKVAGVSSRSVDVGEYEPDEAIVELTAPFDDRARAYMREPIGTLEGGPLAPTNEIAQLPQFLLEDTALLDLVNRVQLYYSGADVSMTAAYTIDDNIEPGEIRRADVSNIYLYDNTLYLLEMTGTQLRTLMEWTMKQYRRYQPHDLTLAFMPDTRVYNMDGYAGVGYEVDVSQDEGSRVRNLRWPNDTMVADDDVLTLAANSFRANSCLLVPGEVFDEGNLPKLLEIDVAGSIGGIPELIGDYIENVCGGIITPAVDGNWRIVGYDWDPKLHQRTVELIAKGMLGIESENERSLPETVITEDDLAGVGDA